jgi:polyisoprenoid-binding protein YceI
MITSEFKINRSDFGIGGGIWNQVGVVAEVILFKVKLLLTPAVASLRTGVKR